MRKIWTKMLAFAVTIVMVLSMGNVSAVFGANTYDYLDITVNYGQTEARRMLNMINDMRTGEDAWALDKGGSRVEYEGLKELTYDPLLEKVAMQRAAELVFSFSHVRPNGQSCETALPDLYKNSAAGENLAMGQKSAEEAFISWSEENEDYDGQGHRRNMLNPNFSAIGIAYAEYNGSRYWVQVFSSKLSSETLGEAFDGNQTATVEVQGEQQIIKDITPGRNKIYYSSNNSTDVLQAIAATLSTVTISTTSGSSHYEIPASWEYNPATNSFHLKEGSYTLPSFLIDNNNVLSKEVLLERIDWNGSYYDTEYSRNSYSAHEGQSFSLALDPYDGKAIFHWYKISGNGMTELSGDSSATCTIRCVSPDDQGNYVVIYYTSYAMFITPVKTLNVSSHTWTESTISKEPTCTEDGEIQYICTYNGCDAVKTDKIQALGHDWDDGILTTPATCDEDGVKTFTCTRCHITKTESVSAFGHTEVIDKAVPATCTEKGLTEGSHCSVCNKVLIPQTEIPALGHNWDDGEITTPATCETDGVKTFTCARCNDTKTESIAATGHQKIDVPEVPATCTKDGTTAGVKCAVCGKVISGMETIAATGHNWDDGQITTPATCTAFGTKTFTCTVCQTTKTESVAKLPHTLVTLPGKEATCTSDGLTEGSICSVCQTVLKAQETISALGHDWDEGIISEEPTCTGNGVITYTCHRCQITKKEAIDPTGHTEQIIPGKEATCVESGLTDGKKCSVCGAILEEQQVIPVTEHTWDEGTVQKKATCTEDGQLSYTCTYCHTTKNETIPAVGHTEIIDEAVPATCTQTGLTEGKHCSVCGEVILAQTETPALGHNWNNGTITTPATCTENGVMTYTCNNCGETRTAVIEATGHTPVTDPAVEATCTQEGKTEGRHCSACGLILKAQETIPALGHRWNDGEITTAPTCTEDGVKTYSCEICSETKTEPVKATGHTVVVDPAVNATATQEGKTEGSHCSVCGTILTAQMVIPKLETTSDNSSDVTTTPSRENGSALAPSDTPKESKTSDGQISETSQNSDVPETSDSVNIAPFILLFLGSIFVSGVLAMRKRKEIFDR